MKKSISWLLAIVSTASLACATACKGNEHYNADNFLTAEQAEAEYGNAYRIVKDTVTLDIFVPRGSMNPAYETMKMFKKLEEVTNLDFNFIEADTSSYTNQRTAAWGDDLPDFFLFGNTVSEQVIYSKEGMLVPFNDSSLEVEGVAVGSLIDNYMPTYKKLLDENFNIETSINAKETATLSDGKMYSTVSAMDVPRDLTYKMWINQKWIENINNNASLKIKLNANFGVDTLPTVDEIDTIDDLLLVLRAFKKLDANMNGNANDEIPVTALEMAYLRNFIMASYGVVSNSVEISNDGTKFDYTPATDAYRQYLKTAHMMYEEGLIDNSTFSMKTDAEMAAKGYEGNLGMFCAAAAYLTVGYNLEADYTALAPITSTYYTGAPLQYGFSPFGADVAVIPSGTPYVREIARLLDIMYSDLGVQLLAYGEENVDWIWDDEAKTSWTFKVPDNWTGTQEEYRATITPNVGTGAAIYWSYDFVGKMNDPIITKLNKESEKYLPFIKVPIPEDVILAAEDYSPASLILTDLGPYVEMTEYNFVTGEKNWDIEVDANWNTYLTELKGYKYEQVVTMYNNALNAKKA